jgi:hypothetical protein
MEEQRKFKAESSLVLSLAHLKAEGMGLREARLGLSTRAKDAVTDLTR